jgi:pimeloyl-[acyl-carrier protein] methyl ester esterase
MSSQVFAEVAGQLADQFHILCPDLPGHGESGPATDSSLAGFATDICAWMSELSVAPAPLLGWSLGGQVALQIAAGSSRCVEKLLLVATTPCFCQADDWPHGLPKTQVRALQRNLQRAYEKTLGDFFNLQFVGENLPKDRYRQIIKFAVRKGHLPAVDAALASLRILGEADIRHHLQQIEKPTLVMHGELDRIVPVGAGEYLAAELPDARYQPFAQIGHAPFFSRPKECVDIWREFLGD